MLTFTHEGATVSVDAEATRAMYERIPKGEAEGCCAPCVYFTQHRLEAYPQYFLELLERLGIDYRKENTMMRFEDDGPPEPDAKWFFYYSDFDFVGTVESSGRRPAPSSRKEFSYSFGGAPADRWTAERAQELGFAPIANVHFKAYLLVPFGAMGNGYPERSSWWR